MKGKKILVFLFVILLVANLSVLYPINANAYEKDIHYWLKFKLAVYCGFTPEEARLIGTGDYGIDANYSTEPTKLDLIPTFSAGQHNLHTNIKMEKHALPRHNPVSNPDEGIPEIAAQQDKLFHEATSTTSVQNNYSLKLIKFGQYLHYVEDKWSHWGSTYEIGHATANLGGKSPDNPYNSKEATKDMIFDVMLQLGNLKGPNSKCYESKYGKPDIFISPVNFPDDFKDKYPNGSPKDPSGKNYPNLQKDRDDYFNRLDNSNPLDKITDVYKHLIDTAKAATDKGKDLEGVVEDDEVALQVDIANELNMDYFKMVEKYDFIPPWDFSTIAGFAIPFFSKELHQGIHWDEDEQPKETINPDPNHVFDNPQINPAGIGSNIPNPTVTPPPVVQKTPSTTNGGGTSTGNLKTATITVIKHVINDGGGTAKASDFTITVDHGYGIDASPQSFPGSESGTTVTITGQFNNGLIPFTVHEHSNVAEKYDQRKSDSCQTYINANNSLTCIIYNKFKVPSSQTSMTTETPSGNLVPSWIKKDASWYVDGEMNGQEFATALGYLAVQNIIPTYLDASKDTQVSVNLDPTIENDLQQTSQDWVSGAIPDSEFVGFVNEIMAINGIEFGTPNLPLMNLNPQTGQSSNTGTMPSSTSNQVTITVMDSSSGKVLDALVLISGNSKYIQQTTDRDGVIQTNLPDGDYEIQIDSSDYQRMITTLHVSGDTKKTIGLEKFQESSSQTNTVPPNTEPIPSIPSSNSGHATVSASPSILSFTHHIGQTSCPEVIGNVNLQSSQQGTWTTLSNPSWTTVTIQGDTATLLFNCQLQQYVTQSLTGSAQFQFTDDSGQTTSTNVSISGQVFQG